MKKLLVLALFCLLAFASQAQAQKTYINGIDPNYPPFAYIDEKTGQPAGFDVESMNWIAKKMGFKVEHKPMAWDGIIPSLLAKQIDMIASGRQAPRPGGFLRSLLAGVPRVPGPQGLHPHSQGHSLQAREAGRAARHLRGRGHQGREEGQGIHL